MVKFNWTINDLENRLDELKKEYYKSNDFTIKENIISDILLLQNVLNNYYDYSFHNTPNLIALYNRTKDINNKFKNIIPEINEFYNLNNQEILLPNLKQRSLSNDSLFDIANEFFKYLGHPFYGYFQKIFRQRKNHIIFSKFNQSNYTYGQIIYLKAHKEAFLEIQRINTLVDIVSLIHELGHVISAYMNSHFIEMQYCEVDTKFLELLFLDYYYNKTLDIEAIYIKASILNSAIISSKQVYNLDKLHTYEKNNYPFTNNKNLKMNAQKICNLEKEELETILKEYNSEMIRSTIGQIYGIELYYNSLEDLNNSLYKLRKIINYKAKNNEDLQNYFKKLYIYPNNHSEIYQRSLNNKVNRLYRSRKAKEKTML